jgi:hypothetical protein
VKELKEFCYIFLTPPLLMIPTVGLFGLVGLHSIGVIAWIIATGIHFAILGGYGKNQ